MVKKSVLFVIVITFVISGYTQQEMETKNVFLVTLDGFRWQEVFNGADKKLIKNNRFVRNPEKLKKDFWREDLNERRETLMPFIWGYISKNGQIYGNRKYQNDVNVSNQFWFSYPGYNEILTGIEKDRKIYLNWKIQNPNITILEYLNSLNTFQSEVAAFCSWDVFPFILNQKRSGIYVNAGNDKSVRSNLSEKEEFLNAIVEQKSNFWGATRPDSITFNFAMEYIKNMSPRVAFISFGETDDEAHAGKYDDYLFSANRTDQYISQLWDYIQSSDVYRNKTTLIITTDHGRGFLLGSGWKRHGKGFIGSDQIWFAIMGPDTNPLGEIKTAGQLYQNQFASTIANLLNVDFRSNKKEGPLIVQAIQKNLNIQAKQQKQAFANIFHH